MKLEYFWFFSSSPKQKNPPFLLILVFGYRLAVISQALYCQVTWQLIPDNHLQHCLALLTGGEVLSAWPLSRCTGILSAGLSPTSFLHRTIMSPALGHFWGVYSISIKWQWKIQVMLKAGSQVFLTPHKKGLNGQERFKGVSKLKALTQPELLWSATPEYKQHLRSGILICLC